MSNKGKRKFVVTVFIKSEEGHLIDLCEASVYARTAHGAKLKARKLFWGTCDNKRKHHIDYMVNGDPYYGS